MPGADTPLFTVPDGRMGVGLGIHGEPGIAEEALPRYIRDKVAKTTAEREAEKAAAALTPDATGIASR